MRSWPPVSQPKPVIEPLSPNPVSLRREAAPRAPQSSAPGGSAMWLLVAIVFGAAIGTAVGAGVGLYVFGWYG